MRAPVPCSLSAHRRHTTPTVLRQLCTAGGDWRGSPLGPVDQVGRRTARLVSLRATGDWQQRPGHGGVAAGAQPGGSACTAIGDRRSSFTPVASKQLCLPIRDAADRERAGGRGEINGGGTVEAVVDVRWKDIVGFGFASVFLDVGRMMGSITILNIVYDGAILCSLTVI